MAVMRENMSHTVREAWESRTGRKIDMSWEDICHEFKCMVGQQKDKLEDDTRAALLKNEIKQQPKQNVQEYTLLFESKRALVPDIGEKQAAILFVDGLLEPLKTQCQKDEKGNAWETVLAASTYAEGQEAKLGKGHAKGQAAYVFGRGRGRLRGRGRRVQDLQRAQDFANNAANMAGRKRNAGEAFGGGANNGAGPSGYNNGAGPSGSNARGGRGGAGRWAGRFGRGAGGRHGGGHGNGAGVCHRCGQPGHYACECTANINFGPGGGAGAAQGTN